MGIDLGNAFDQGDLTPRTGMVFDTKSGVRQLPTTAQRVLLVGQQLATATQPVNTVLQNFRETDAAGAHGDGCALDLAARAAYAANPEADIYTLGVIDAVGAVAATLAITFAVNALKDFAGRLRSCGTEALWAVLTGDTPTVQAAAAVVAINAQRLFPFTATSALGVLTLTAKNKGTAANGISVLVTLDGDGIGTTVAPASANLAGGATDPSLAAALAAVSGQRFHEVAILLADTTSGEAGQAHVEGEGDGEHGRGEVATQAINGLLTAATTLTAALNGQRNLVAATKGSPTWHVQINAGFAAVIASESQPNRPLNGLVIAGVEPPPVASRWIESETKALLAAGATPLVVNASEQVCILRAVSTQVKNEQGDTDYTLLDIGTIKAFDYLRDANKLMFDTSYARVLWADDDTDGLLPDDVATPAKVRLSLIEVAHQLEAAGIVQSVDQNLSFFDVEKTGADCIYQVPANIIPGLQRVFGKAVLIRQPLAA